MYYNVTTSVWYMYYNVTTSVCLMRVLCSLIIHHFLLCTNKDHKCTPQKITKLLHCCISKKDCRYVVHVVINVESDVGKIGKRRSGNPVVNLWRICGDTVEIEIWKIYRGDGDVMEMEIQWTL